jgi:hypothetical protein
MSSFKKFFGSGSDQANEEENSEYNSALNSELPIDEQFTFNFKKNGGKFIYCENKDEIREQFENILEENDWYESEVLCHDSNLYYLLEENKLSFSVSKDPKFLLASCENLIAEDGSVFFSSKQIKQLKPHELPANMVIVATTSQIIGTKGDGMHVIKNKYTHDKEYPNNITTLKYFEKAKEEDFLTYGSAAKNLYLLLLEDL